MIDLQKKGELMKKKIVMLQGAFEVINAGHVRELRACREQGDYLIVALNTNELLKEYKHRDAVLPWDQKREILEAIRWVDKVIPAPDFSPIELLKQYDVDVYCIAPEWVDSKKEEIAYMKHRGGEVFITTYHDDIVTTRMIKARLLEEAKGK